MTTDSATESPLRRAAPEPVSILVYRSRAVSVPDQREFEKLAQQAQERNRAESVTGLLIYDRGVFFQWLEGPHAGVTRIWDSIRRDPRHRDHQILRSQEIPKRFFGGWHLRLALRLATHDTAFAIVASPEPAYETPAGAESRPALALREWDEIFAEVVLPALEAGHLSQAMPMAFPWHADPGAPAALAGLALAADSDGPARYIDGLLEQGASLDMLCQEVFEPAMRHLGALWDQDHLSEFEVTLGLSRLQLEARRSGARFARPAAPGKPGHAVLVVPQPGEPHGMNAAMASELFHRDGWDVSCEFPRNDEMLQDMVHDCWFDVLDLSLSGAQRREHRLQAMEASVRAARAASQNPALAVIVGGREFVERPHAYVALGADAASVTVADTVGTARHLVETRATQDRIERSMVDAPRTTPRRLRNVEPGSDPGSLNP